MASQVEGVAVIPAEFPIDLDLLNRCLRRHAEIARRLADPKLTSDNLQQLRNAQRTAVAERKRQLLSSVRWHALDQTAMSNAWLEVTSIFFRKLNRYLHEVQEAQPNHTAPRAVQGPSPHLNTCGRERGEPVLQTSQSSLPERITARAPLRPPEQQRLEQEKLAPQLHPEEPHVPPIEVRRVPMDFRNERHYKRWIREQRRRVTDTREYPDGVNLGHASDTSDGKRIQLLRSGIAEVRMVPIGSKRGPLQRAIQAMALSRRQAALRKERIWEEKERIWEELERLEAVSEQHARHGHSQIDPAQISTADPSSEHAASEPPPRSASDYAPFAGDGLQEETTRDLHIVEAVHGYIGHVSRKKR